jgi:hypothetical protein
MVRTCVTGGSSKLKLNTAIPDKHHARWGDCHCQKIQTVKNPVLRFAPCSVATVRRVVLRM